MMQQQMMMALQSRASGSHAAASQMPIQPHHHHDLTENDSWDDVMGNPQRVGDSTRQLSSLASPLCRITQRLLRILSLVCSIGLSSPFWAAQKVESFRSSDFRFCWNPGRQC